MLVEVNIWNLILDGSASDLLKKVAGIVIGTKTIYSSWKGRD